jgi:hypothetical protein
MGDFWETASELESIARHLRLAGEVELRAELQKAVTGAVRDAEPEIRAGLRDHLPDPYAAVLGADLRISTSTRLAGDDPVVRLYGQPQTRKRKLRQLDERGVLGHPVFGMRSRTGRGWVAWSYQSSHVRAGWFTGPAEADAPRVKDAIERALTVVAEKAVRKGP